MMLRLHFAKLLILLVVSIPGILTAQRPVTLDEAIALTLRENFDIQIEDRRMEIAANNNNWEAAGRYPSISLSVQNGNQLVDVDNPASFINGQYTNLGVTGAADLNWVLFSGFRVNINKSRLAELERQAGGNAALVIENNLQAVILQYYDCLIQQQRMEVLEQNLTLSRDRYAYAQSKRELGSGTTFDLLTIETGYFTDSSNFLQQALGVENAVRSLNNLIGIDPDSMVVPTGELPDTFDRYSLEDLEAQMLRSNLNLRNQFINLELLRTQVELAQADRYPTIALNLGTSYSTNRFQLEGREAAAGRQINYYANFTLSYNLYNGSTVRRNIENAEINTRIGQLNIAAMEQDMSYQLRNALELYEVRRNLLAVTELTLQTAERNLTIAETKYKNGTLNSLNFRDVQLVAVNASLSQAQALYSVLEAETQLIRLIGGIIDLDGNVIRGE